MNRVWVAVSAIIIAVGAITLVMYLGSAPPSKFTLSIGQPSVNYTTIGTKSSSAQVITSETFSVSIGLPQKVNANLEASGMPKGVWVRFEPSSLLGQGPGTVAVKMVLAGAVQPFKSTPHNTTISISLVSGNSEVATVPLTTVQTEYFTLIKAPGEIPLVYYGRNLTVNINGTSIPYFGLVYDPPTCNSGGIPVEFTVAGINQSGAVAPLPSWLKAYFPNGSLKLNACEPIFLALYLTAPMGIPGGYTILVNEKVGDTSSLAPLKVWVVEPPRSSPPA